MSTGGISARNLHLRQGGRDTIGSVSMSANVPILYIAEQNIIIKKNNTPPIKEGDKKMYTRVVFFWRFFFFFFHSDIIRYSVDKRYGVGPRSTASPYKTFLVPPT